eukprot:m51a1_g5804 putative atp-dependent dna helicase pif1-like (828) ;mRNA; f:131507-135489
MGTPVKLGRLKELETDPSANAAELQEMLADPRSVTCVRRRCVRALAAARRAAALLSHFRSEDDAAVKEEVLRSLREAGLSGEPGVQDLAREVSSDDAPEELCVRAAASRLLQPSSSSSVSSSVSLSSSSSTCRAAAVAAAAEEPERRRLSLLAEELRAVAVSDADASRKRKQSTLLRRAADSIDSARSPPKRLNTGAPPAARGPGTGAGAAGREAQGEEEVEVLDAPPPLRRRPAPTPGPDDVWDLRTPTSTPPPPSQAPTTAAAAGQQQSETTPENPIQIDDDDGGGDEGAGDESHDEEEVVSLVVPLSVKLREAAAPQSPAQAAGSQAPAAAAPERAWKPSATSLQPYASRDLHPLSRARGVLSVGAARPQEKKRAKPQQQQQQQRGGSGGGQRVRARPRRDEGARLSADQRQVLEHALAGGSFFFTGAAGSGKSFLLRHMAAVLEELYPGQVFVTASTGTAACGIGGVTVHSFAGIGIGEGEKEVLARRVMSQKASTRWFTCKVLFIDEVSMVSGELFEKLEYVARAVRKSVEPFGGIQVILCGDFFQLPPVLGAKERKLCFEAACWNDVVKQSFQLTTIFRQRDRDFIEMLEEIRTGDVSTETWRKLDMCSQRLPSTEPTTKLFPHRNTVDTENHMKLDQLPGEKYVFVSEDWAKTDSFQKALDNGQLPKELHLKVGSQVVLLKNMDFESGLVNGALGTVLEFGPRSAETGLPGEVRVKFQHTVQTLVPEDTSIEVGGMVVATRKQFPLKLAWALSIHKSQGMTLPRVELSLENIFATGQAYVALSRATSLEGIRIIGRVPRNCIKKPDPRVIAFYKNLVSLS